jgi:gentisate 1,2-dioxygenase
MANPVPGNDYPTITTIVGAYQMVKGKETARSHRHTPNAMRIVLEAGARTYTVVDGVKVPMEPGDVLLTPNWCYHGHNNESDQDAYWIDFLDAPLVQFLDPMFFEHSEEPPETICTVEVASPMRFAYTEYRPRLMQQPSSDLGVRELHLGPPELVTFDRTALHLAASSCWSRPRTTVSRIYTVLEGSGRCSFADREVRWSHGDMIAVPNWHEHTLVCDTDSILIQVSDEPLLRMLGWLRHQN